jgi:hypothetical protein
MTGRHAVVALIAGLFATSAAADNAVRRDGSSSGGGSGNAGSNQPSAHSSSSGSSGSSGSSYSDRSGSSGGSSHPSHGLSPAQRRQPRPGTGTGGHSGYYPGYGYPGYGYGYYPGYGYGYYPGYGYGSYWWPYGSFYAGVYGGGYYGGGYYGGGYYPPTGGVYTYAYDDRASLRILVDEPHAKVYVDGHYAGVVDDFDGLFQRLYVSPGKHDIAFKLEGYQTHHVKVYVESGATLKIHHDMQKGTGPESVEDLAGDVVDRYARHEDDRYRARNDDQRLEPRDRDAEDALEDRPAARGDRVPSGERGRLHLNVLPEDASVYVDGQFKGSARQASSLELPAGRHRIEVVRPGFRTDERDFEIETGVIQVLSVELQRP